MKLLIDGEFVIYSLTVLSDSQASYWIEQEAEKLFDHLAGKGHQNWPKDDSRYIGRVNELTSELLWSGFDLSKSNTTYSDSSSSTSDGQMTNSDLLEMAGGLQNGHDHPLFSLKSPMLVTGTRRTLKEECIISGDAQPKLHVVDFLGRSLLGNIENDTASGQRPSEGEFVDLLLLVPQADGDIWSHYHTMDPRPLS